MATCTGDTKTLGPITLCTEAGARPWTPTVRQLRLMSRLVTSPVSIRIVHRRDVGRFWPASVPVSAGPYAFRAFTRRNRIVAFVDATETQASLAWLLLHELAHTLVNSDTALLRRFRSQPKPPGYPVSDDQHAAWPEEKFANDFADRCAASLGVSAGLDRHWWRARVARRDLL